MRRLRLLLAVGCAAFLAAALVIAAAGLRDELAPADAIVVLGNTVGPDGKPSPRLQGRLDGALAAYRAQYAPLLIVSGGTGREGFDEAAVMADYLVAQGVPRAAVLVDSAGIDTAATAVNVARIGKERNIRSVIVATQYFHVLRTRLALSRSGLEVVGSVHGRHFEARDIYSLAREVVGVAAYATGLKGSPMPPAPRRPSSTFVLPPATNGTAAQVLRESNS